MRILAAILAVCLVQPAWALSCMRPDAATDFHNAQASQDVWIIVEGRLTFDQSKLPKRDLTNQNQKDMDLPARLKGMSLGDDGFTRKFSRDITLRLVCFGPWCGGAKSGTEVVAFLKREDSAYVMFADPCGTRVYAPTKEVKRTLTQCFNGGACEKARPRR